MRLLTIVLAAAWVLAAAPRPLRAQGHPADPALAGSLLTAVSLPVSAGALWPDSARLAPVVRGEVQYSRLAGGEAAGSRTILGVRWDSPSSDSTVEWAGVKGLRLAVTHGEDGRPAPSAIELQLGIRALGHLKGRARPDAGLEVLLGLSRLDRPDIDFTLGIRMPVEWVLPAGPGVVLLSAVPTVAWGDVHIEGCVDHGSGDNCGDLGVQIEPGRTRFLLAAGLGYALPSGLTASVGLSRLLAAGQPPRLALGIAWARKTGSRHGRAAGLTRSGTRW